MHLAHPVYVKPFAKKHVKDKVNAGVLAQLLSMDYSPVCSGCLCSRCKGPESDDSAWC